MFDYTVFIGRFQPFHQGHLSVVNFALERSKEVIILVGSSYKARSVRNPFTFEERSSHIQAQVANTNVHILPLRDHLYNEEKWLEEAQRQVYSIADPEASIALVGFSKDATSYYLKSFPQWESINFKAKHPSINSTQIREEFFANGFTFEKVSSGFLGSFFDTSVYKRLKGEQLFIEKYNKQWENSPYPPTFVTVDAVVVQSGHILMVRRGAHPGKGQLALPGGFIHHEETLLDSCIRELREETRIKVPAPVLKGSIKEQRTFDDPHRSSRGRTVTTAFYIELEPSHDLPKVKGGDDAARAFWVPLGQLDPTNIFEDHFHIIESFVG